MKQKFLSSSHSTVTHVLHDLNLVRAAKPIIHNITNFVVMQTSANILLAVGASPIMAHALNELQEIVALAHALVINIGTLDESWNKSIEFAHDIALKRHIPIIFDPVGAGATTYRTQTAKMILQRGVTILRGNASEIMALTDAQIKSRGVDSKHASEYAITAARKLAKNYHCIVVISGEIDFIVDCKRVISLTHGTPLFTSITGMGCAATALIGAFAAVNKDYSSAAVHAMALFSLAGENVANSVKGPASFYQAFVDELYHFNHEHLTLNVKQL